MSTTTSTTTSTTASTTTSTTASGKGAAPDAVAVRALQARVRAFAGKGATAVAPMTYHR